MPLTSPPDRTMDKTHSPTPLSPAVLAVGDVLLLIAFAVIGRASHHETNLTSLARTLGVATPFLAGWAIGSALTDGYRRTTLTSLRSLLVRTAIAWLMGGVIGLGIRSGLEHRIVPIGFAIVALSFNLATLEAWRSVYWVVSRR